ncbi:acyl-CoA synthetase family protein [Hyphococcus lacteus]|uniref:AMP-dependent synthetase/ligase domain-containing protein n=1 Tax=Hyphococcus lacteus TaxID=3143536 RepID=A0ABV3Z6R0_9PROT
MKSFAFKEEQISRVIGAASADELARRFNRHIDFLTIASWTQDTKLERGGMALTAAEKTACAERAATMFGFAPDFLKQEPADKISDWARSLSNALASKLVSFSFKPAARSNQDIAYQHRADAIFQDAAAAANVLYGRRRLLSFVAPHSLLGIELSILTPNLLGVESVDARGMTPDVLSKSLLFGDVLVATPTLWRYMMQEKLKAPDNTLAVSFGEPMTPELAVEMRKSGFGVLRELYGSTETGLIGWRDTPGEAFALFDHWRKAGDDLMRIMPDSTEELVEPMDILQWDGERSFALSGRRDGAVQIGAVNVFPDVVSNALRSHPHIKECEIVVGRRSDGASRLVAHIVLSEKVQPNERTARDIDTWCRANLRQQERPQIYNFEAP